MRFSPAYLGVLIGAVICPTYAVPLEADSNAVRYKDVYARIHARGQSSSTPTTPTTTMTPSSRVTPSATPSESIILALQGEDEWFANGKTKWLTYFVSDGKDPDWCKGSNAEKKLKGDDSTTLPPNIDYDIDSGDAFLNGCTYDRSAYTFTCGDWSATCTVIKGRNSGGVSVNGKEVGTCNDLPVKKFVVCKQDDNSPALPTSAAATSTPTHTASGVTEPQYTAACTQGMRNATTWKDYNMADFLREE